MLIDLVRTQKITIHGVKLECIGINSLPIHPETHEYLTRDIGGDNTWKFLCSAEDRDLIRGGIPQYLLVDMWKDIATKMSNRVFTTGDPEIRIENAHHVDSVLVYLNETSFENGEVFWWIRHSHPPFDEDTRKTRGDLWSSNTIRRIPNWTTEEKLQQYDTLYDLLHVGLNRVLIKYKTAKEALSMARNLARVASFRGTPPLLDLPLTRAAKLTREDAARAEATTSNDASTAASALAIFQQHYLKPTLRDLGVQIPYTFGSVQPLLSAARASPYLRSLYQ